MSQAQDNLAQETEQGKNMNAAHAHLILNHLPLSGLIVALPILLLAAWKKDELLGRVGMAIVVMASLLVIPTFLTGEPAEELIEHLPGVSEALIEAHEEAAEKAIWAVGFAGLAALLGLWASIRRKTIPGGVLTWVILIVLGAGGFLVWTHNLGGAIRHPEIRESDPQVLRSPGETRSNTTGTMEKHTTMNAPAGRSQR